jgi:hypothetical protein
MDTLHDRLAELAADAPTGGAPAAELWGRGKRAHRLRAAAVAAALVVLGTVGTGVGVRLADGDGDRSIVVSAGSDGITLRSSTPLGMDCRVSGTLPDRWRRSGWLPASAAARRKSSASSREPGGLGPSDQRGLQP